MTYLYAGLGIAMLTAVMAMFQVAMGLTQQQIASKPPQDSYVKSPWQSNDQQFLRLIQTMDSSWGSGSTLCGKIMQTIAVSSTYPNLSGYGPGLVSSSGHARLAGACALANAAHRVVIAPAPAGATGYRLYSCLIQGGDVDCAFERN
ncbi:MAG: hypothetical protein FJ050_11415 [Cyanobacteria bacterium M_surface_7_m2_040]|nr:hypothetical protein [Cyanobacteria bacterium M_surface_7_m2_040]